MATVSVNAPKTPVTAGSMGIAAATLPNVCKMPGPPAPFVPVPLPNIGKSGDSPKGYSKSVEIEGNKVAIRGATFNSMGDVASKGTGGGIVSMNTHGPTSFVGPGSMDVEIEGKNVQLLSDPMLNNNGPSGNPPNSATLLGLVQPPGIVIAVVGDESCPICGQTHGDAARLAETPDTATAAGDLQRAAQAAVAAARLRRPQLIEKLKRDATTRTEEAKAEIRRDIESMNKSLANSHRIPGDKRETVVAQITRSRTLAEERLAAVNIKPRDVGVAEMATMLGVALCKDRPTHIYAAKSDEQLLDLNQQLAAGNWHLPASATTILREGTNASPNEAARRNRFRAHLPSSAHDGFEGGWLQAWARSDEYNADKAKKKPAYPPGTCAGPQAVLLALDHGAWPVALTERRYDSEDANAVVRVYYRTEIEDTVGKPGEFGGAHAVPPCHSCELVLPMLICPNGRKTDCSHSAPTTPDTCKCQA